MTQTELQKIKDRLARSFIPHQGITLTPCFDEVRGPFISVDPGDDEGYEITADDYDVIENSFKDIASLIKEVENVERSRKCFQISAKYSLMEIKELKQAVRELAESLVWCSGSNDFALDGKARKGWKKGPMKILRSQIVKRIMQEEPCKQSTKS